MLWPYSACFVSSPARAAACCCIVASCCRCAFSSSPNPDHRLARYDCYSCWMASVTHARSWSTTLLGSVRMTSLTVGTDPCRWLRTVMANSPAVATVVAKWEATTEGGRASGEVESPSERRKMP